MQVFGVGGLNLTYADLPYNRRKFVQFCLSVHKVDIPTWPMFPCRLATLVRYAWWLQFHGIRGGMPTIRNYVSAVVEWGLSLGHSDPRMAEPWIYQRFRREAPKHLQVMEGSKAKYEIQQLTIGLQLITSAGGTEDCPGLRFAMFPRLIEKCRGGPQRNGEGSWRQLFKMAQKLKHTMAK